MILASLCQVMSPWTYVLVAESQGLQMFFNIIQKVFYLMNLLYSCALLYVFYIFAQIETFKK